MSERIKRLLLIVGFIASVFFIGALLYFTFFWTSPTQPTSTSGEPQLQTNNLGGLTPSQEGTPTTGTPPTQTQPGLVESDEIASGGITKTTELTTAPIYNSTLAQNGNSMQFYDRTEGKFYQIDADGNITALSEKEFPSVNNVVWDQNASKAVLEFPDGSNVVYDFENETQVTLPKHWEDFDFSPTSNELIAKSLGIDPKNRFLVVSNDDGSNVKTIQALGDNEDKVDVNWSPNNQVIAFSDTAEGLGSFDRKTIIPLGKSKENFKGLVVEGLGFVSNWAPGGKQLVYSVAGAYSNYRPLLWVVDATSATMGENRKSIPLNTWADKCTFSSQTKMYCAVPIGLPANAGLQRSVFEQYPDALYEVDIASGQTNVMAIPESNTTMKNLFVTQDESLLYFTNHITGKLEYLKLK